MRKDSAILVVDDEAVSRVAIARSLSGAGFKIVQAATGEDGLWAIDQHQFSCVLADFRLPDIDGQIFARQCHRIAPTLPLIVMSETQDGAAAAQCLEEGAVGCLLKPLSSNKVLLAVSSAIEKCAGRPGVAGP